MLYLLLTLFGLAVIGWAVSLFMSAREVQSAPIRAAGPKPAGYY